MKLYKTPILNTTEKNPKEAEKETTLLFQMEGMIYFISLSPEKYVSETVWSKLKWVIKGWRPIFSS